MSIRGLLRHLVNTTLGRKAKMLAPGHEAPDFEASDQNGRRIRLSALRGKTVVLWFFPKADTPG